MVNDVTLSASARGTLNSINRSQKAIDDVSLRLSTGKKVNSVLDDSFNFFNANYLNNTASDYSKLLDGLSLATLTLQNALSGVEAVKEILDLAEIKATEAKEALEKTSSALTNAVLEDAPVGYFRLNDVASGTALNLGTLGAGGDGVYTGNVTQGDEILFYGSGGLPARFGGQTGDFVAVPVDDSINTLGPYNEKTIELIFNADTVAGRQILWEEGGPVNSLNIYIDNGLLYVNGRTTNAGGYGPLNINTPIESGVTYHVALVQDANNNTFAGYLNGEQFGSQSIPVPIGSHPNRNAIGAMDQNTYFHDDGPGNAPGRPDGTFAFQGEIAEVAFYNTIIPPEDLVARYEATSLPLSERFRQETVTFMEQIGEIVVDTNFQGINLLEKGTLDVDLNGDLSDLLRIEGVDITLESLGLDNIAFQKPSQVEATFTSIEAARKKLDDFATQLVNTINIIEIREDFTRNQINTHRAGADDLILADLNEEGANQLAAQTRLDLSTTALSLVSQSQLSILDLFSNGTGQVI